eukprot:SAG31_NODE_1009_length_10404_cov_27.639981_10_plen_250_part_00
MDAAMQRRFCAVAGHIACGGAGGDVPLKQTAVEPDTYRSADPLPAAVIDALPSYSAATISELSSRSQILVVIRGLVYDLTNFAATHPGGRRALLRHAGTDATKVFEEVHTRAVLRMYSPSLVVGRLTDSAKSHLQTTGIPNATSVALGGASPLVSPFPAEQFDGARWNAVEAFKFQWAAAPELLRADPPPIRRRHSPTDSPTDSLTDMAKSSRAVEAAETWNVHRAKSYVSPLDVGRDWLHCSADKYAV